jgi:hypothetical protein
MPVLHISDQTMETILRREGAATFDGITSVARHREWGYIIVVTPAFYRYAAAIRDRLKYAQINDAIREMK